MLRPLNLYSITRTTDTDTFNALLFHEMGFCKKTIHSYEIESLKLLADRLIKENLSVKALDGFIISYQIPHIGKEFDLLKISDDLCLNIELKSQKVTEESILEQLHKNAFYLRPIGKRVQLFTVVTDSFVCYELREEGLLTKIDFSVIVKEIEQLGPCANLNIEDIFAPSKYLISPLNTPEKFIKEEYFLTVHQANIKNSILKSIDQSAGEAFFLIEGGFGTGKTLLLYDIAKKLSQRGKTVIIHCGKLPESSQIIADAFDDLTVIPVSSLKYNKVSLKEYDYILVDEAQRIYSSNLDEIIKAASVKKGVCIFCVDQNQTLSVVESNRKIVEQIKKLNLADSFVVGKSIRTNEKLYSFIRQVVNLSDKPKCQMDYSCVDLCYANNIDEAKLLIDYYRENEYVFINYSKSNRNYSPYQAYEEDFDTHHVIGQEFDKVLLIMDDNFYYDGDGVLKGRVHPNPDYLYSKLFYQNITRVRNNLAIIIVDAPELMTKITSIVDCHRDN